jgi:ligand-binding sensor domain-containing protein
MMTKLLFITLFSFLGISKLIAQDTSYSISTYRNGNEISSLAISNSSVFVGTTNGVYQRSYNGDITNIHNYEKGLLNDCAYAIFVESEDKVWFATANGLHLYNNNKYLIYDKSSGLLNNSVRSICSDSRGSIWAANSNGLSQFKDNTWSSYTIPFSGYDTISFNSIICNSGLVWGTSSGNGLYAFNGSSFVVYDTSKGLPGNDVISLQNDTANVLWIASANNGLVEHKDGSWIQHYDNILDNRVINDFVIDKNNCKWIFTNNGVIKSDQETWSVPESLSGLYVKTGRIDADNNLWIVTDTQLIKYIPAIDSIVRFKVEGMLDSFISTICIDDNNVKWIGNMTGISKLDKDWSTIPFHDVDSLSEGPYITISDIQHDQNNNIWVSYYSPGNICVSSFNGTKWQRHYSDKFVMVSSLAVAANNYIWAANDRTGLLYFNGTNWAEAPSTNSLPGSWWSQEVAIDKKNNIWAGTYQCIAKYDGKFYESYSIAPDVQGIAIDSENKLWVAAQDVNQNGLFMYDGSNWKTFNTDSGLAERYVRKVIVDKLDNVWCGYNSKGLTMYNPKKNTWKTYNSSDGLANDQVNALAVDSSNNIYVGTPYGLSILQPSTVTLKVMGKKNDLKSSNITIDVPVTVEKFNKIKHVAYVLHFDNNILKFNTLAGGALYGLSLNDFDLSDTLNGNIKFDYKNHNIICQSINKGETICNLTFEVRNTSTDSTEILLSGIVVENFKDEKLGYKVNSTKFKITDWFNSIDEKTNPNSILSLYPNPAKEILIIDSREKIRNVIIFDMSGKKLKNVVIDHAQHIELNVRELAKGIYILKISTESGEKFTKLIKE